MENECLSENVNVVMNAVVFKKGVFRDVEGLNN